MDIRDFLARLSGVRGPNQRGAWTANCPGPLHRGGDKGRHLSVEQGRKGIIITCHKGCSNEDIIQAMGLTMKDLFDNHDQGRRPASGSARPAPQAPPKARSTYEWDDYAKAYAGVGRFQCAYPYRDAEGKLLFEVVRILQPDGKKTMRQHTPVDGAKGPLPFTKGVPEDLRSAVPYRLPELLDAIAKGQTVYVVEGEKDADRLAALGRAATCNACGAGKWKESHSKWLEGADAVVIPDNDDLGHNAARIEAEGLLGIAKAVRMIDLRDGWKEIPDKGDFSDMADALGDAEALRILDAIAGKTDIMEQDDRQRVAALYARVPGYCVEDGCICAWNGETIKRLCTFMVWPRLELTKDDGVTQTTHRVLDGWSMNGVRLPTVVIPTEEFSSMRWPETKWGYHANVAPGTATRDKLRYCIGEVGREGAERQTVYTHTGWRQVDGTWAYLYQGGAVGAENVSVDLGSGLESYSLDKVPEGSYEEAAMKSYGLCFTVKTRVAWPVLGITYLAPLREFLSQRSTDVGFSMFIVGRTGTRKSTLTALALSHFGQFTGKSLPASFNDTSNYIRKKAFYLKDCLLAVDDYHPSTSPMEKRQMARTAQELSRAFGDSAGRGRMLANTELQRSMPPRALAIMSGEEMPQVGESGVARYFTLRLEEEDVPIGDDLTKLQDDAAEGWLRLSMRGYLEWLAPQAGQLPDELMEMFRDLRAAAQEKVKGVHPRSHEAMAMLMVGLTMFLRYLSSLKILAESDIDIFRDEMWNVLAEHVGVQREEREEDKPGNLFIAAVRELILSRSVYVASLGGEESGNTSARVALGYADTRHYLLYPDIAFTQVVAFYRQSGLEFPVGKHATFRDLREMELVDVGKDGKVSRPARLPGGKMARMLWVPRWLIDGTEKPPWPVETGEQEEMKLEEEEG